VFAFLVTLFNLSGVGITNVDIEFKDRVNWIAMIVNREHSSSILCSIQHLLPKGALSKLQWNPFCNNDNCTTSDPRQIY